jgi:hypothetical protein
MIEDETLEVVAMHGLPPCRGCRHAWAVAMHGLPPCTGFRSDELPFPSFLLSTGRKEFADFLPEGTQGIVVQPVGKLGVLVAGTDTVRGISMLDQVRGGGQECGSSGFRNI